MPRKSRRTGVRYIEDDRDRITTLGKRRDGLFKLANDLSILTGASVAICLHGNNKVQLFGAPLAEPIVNAFVSGYPPMDADEQAKANIVRLQNQVLQLESELAEKGKKLKQSVQRFKEAQDESLGMAKHIFSKVVDLNHGGIHELLHALSLIQREIQK
ncbi:hypothetical protein ABZP36_001136 [Zizania latifolia]